MSTYGLAETLGRKFFAVAAVVALMMPLGGQPALALGTESPAPAGTTQAPKADYNGAVKLVKAGKYKDGLAALKALNAPEDANVLNYMGFASRKLGDLKNAERYYKAALKIDPKHRGALEYYGELFVEKGNAKGAMTNLASLKALCGNCEEYQDLKNAMQKAGMAVN